MSENGKSVSNGKKTGPEPDRLKVDDDWHDAIGKAIKKERPKDGWPESEKKEKVKKTKG